MGEPRIGTSGWQYDHWKSTFFGVGAIVAGSLFAFRPLSLGYFAPWWWALGYGVALGTNSFVPTIPGKLAPRIDILWQHIGAREILAYFVALAVALPEVSESVAARAAFVAGVALSSLSWQTILAAVGATLHARLSTRVERTASAVGGIIVVALAARIAADALGL